MSASDLMGGLGISVPNTRQPAATYVAEEEEEVVQETENEVKKRKIKENAKQPINSKCQCGSGKKYKKCCAIKDVY